MVNMMDLNADELKSTFDSLNEVLKAKKKADGSPSVYEEGGRILAAFMKAAGEPITWVETRELWQDMNLTNNGKFPNIEDTWNRLLTEDSQVLALPSGADVDGEDVEEENPAKVDATASTDVDNTTSGEGDSSSAASTADNEVAPSSETLSVEDMVHVARRIKETYNIRLTNDTSEFKFVMCSLGLLWFITVAVAVTSYWIAPSAKDSLGRFSWAVFAEAIILFVVELIWECMLSWVVLRYKIKINYTRKLGNLLKVPKFFAADLLPFYDSTILSLMTSLAFSQTLFCLMFFRKSRERYSFFSYVFLSQDRREDRPDTLTFQVTEDIMRFAVYFPFKIYVANRVGHPEIIFIPIAVNNIGDGLAEPVGVAFGKHKYTTTALYYKGKFWNGKFTRSLEGSACVYFTTLIVVAVNWVNFNTQQFWITLSILPFLMTIAEAKAPHTNDGPFLALIGCGFLSAIYLA